MLVALCATEAVGWEDLEAKVSKLPGFGRPSRLTATVAPREES